MQVRFYLLTLAATLFTMPNMDMNMDTSNSRSLVHVNMDHEIQIQHIINNHQWHDVPTPADGHCLLHAIRYSWHHQINGTPVPSHEDVLSSTFIEVVNNVERYLPFITDSDKHKLSLELGKYLLSRHYDSSFGDVIPYIIANAYTIRLCIIDMTSGQQHIHWVVPDSLFKDTVVIHKLSDHYSGVQCDFAVVPSTLLASKTLIKSYGADQLMALRSRPCPIRREVRKRLFTLRLWSPKTKRLELNNPSYSNVIRSLTYPTWVFYPLHHLRFAIVNVCSSNTNFSWVCTRKKRRRIRGKKAGWQKKRSKISVVVDVFERSETPVHIDRHVTVDRKNLLRIPCISSHCFGSGLNVTLWNARSMVNKIPSICDAVHVNKTDLFIITESWINSEADKCLVVDADIKSSLENYSVHHAPRKNRKGGGISVIIKSHLKSKMKKSHKFKSFELFDLYVYGGKDNDVTHFLNIYRPPPSTKNVSSVSEFLREFSTLLESTILESGHLVILGDFNIHMEAEINSDSAKFKDLLESFGLVQNVTGPTHEKGHTIDLVISRMGHQHLSLINTDFSMPSDHAALHFKINFMKPPPTTISRTYRKTKNIDLDVLQRHLSSYLHDVDTVCDINVLAVKYHDSLKYSLDKLAPVKIKSSVVKHRAKWFSEDLLNERKSLRLFEQKWVKSKLLVDKLQFVQARSAYKNKVDKVKSDYFKSKIDNAESDKILFTIVDEISGNKGRSVNILPELDSGRLPDVFADFFDEKIAKIRCNLSDSPLQHIEAVTAVSCFNKFYDMSINGVCKVIHEMKNKSCSLDPIPTAIVKQCMGLLAPVFTKIVNTSFNTGIFPDICKTAIVKPLIKKSDLDRNILKNYRPVSNCSLLDKFLEKCAYLQINDYLCKNSLYGKFQSAYRKSHSTETALLRIQSDVLLALDKRKDVILVMLDLSAAFDTIDHSLLLNRLQRRFGFGELALDWMKSFLCGRSQKVMVGSVVSEARELMYGVPQGSVLGPVLFSLYVTPLEDIIESHGCQTVIFADDTQLYITCESDASIVTIESCMVEIKSWMSNNFLSLNDSKSEVVCFSSRFKTSGPCINSILIGDIVVDTSSLVRNLGVMFDSNVTMSSQVSGICRSASFSLWRLGKIRHLLDNKSTERLIHAFITSRLDYCNSVLFGLPDYQLQKLQSIQNSAARLVSRVRRTDDHHITSILRSLHWLPVGLRIQYKLLCIVFKCIYWDCAPSYLKELISLNVQGRYSLRGHNSLTLKVPPVRTLKSYGDRAFLVSAPKLWNALPDNIRSVNLYETFKRRLKTYYFCLFYGN